MKKLSLSAIFILSITTISLCADDPLATEIARWQEFVRTNPATDEDWKYIKETAEPLLVRAQNELKKGRRFFGFHILALIRPSLAASKFVADHPTEAQQLALFEQEWRKLGKDLAPVLEGKERPELTGYPAAVRAAAEASYSEIKVYYDASVEYGRNTQANYGVYYLGSAEAQYDFTKFCKTLRSDATYKPITIGNFKNEIDSFEDTLLAAYKPPVSIDQHPIFIRVSAMIKQARELYDAGSYNGALYRYLEARYRYFRALEPGKGINAEEAAKRAKELESRLDQNSGDNTIGLLFVEMALSEAEDVSPNSQGGTNARVIFDDVLRHYFSTLEPAKVQPPAVTPVATVTLVRWPYT
jgi:hypothetical protein